MFDYRVVFNLDTGKIVIDLPSTSGLTGVTGISVKVQTPISVISPAGYPFLPPFTTPWQTAIPLAINTYAWGLYTITLTAAPTNEAVVKTLNLCAVNPNSPTSNHMDGQYSVMVDCCNGKINVRDLTNYAYRGLFPVSQVINITRYYPPEAELPPQKGINVLPFSIDAYAGTNTFKGKVTSQYNFGSGVYVYVNAVTSQVKEVRCVVDYGAIYCGMEALLRQLNNCHATPEEYNVALGQVNALLWTVMAGEQAGYDVSEPIAQLEKLLGVECVCSGCAGTRVGPATCSVDMPLPYPVVEKMDFEVVEMTVGVPASANPPGTTVPAGGTRDVTLNYKVVPKSETIFYQGVPVRLAPALDFNYTPDYNDPANTKYHFSDDFTDGYALKFNFAKTS